MKQVSFILSLCLGLSLAWTGIAMAQSSLSIVVHAADKKAPSKLPALMVQNMVQASLMKRGKPHWEYLDSAQNLAAMLATIEGSEGGPAGVPGNLSGADLELRLGPVSCERGSCRCQVQIIESSTTRRLEMLQGEGPKAQTAVADAIGKSLVVIGKFDDEQQKLDPRIHVRLRNLPKGMELKMAKAFRRSCSQVKLQYSARTNAKFLLRCKLDPVEIQALLGEAAGKAKFKMLQVSRTGIIMQFE